MKKTYLLFSLLFALIGIVLSCSKTEEEYVIVPVVKSEMPYAKLSDYGFFTGTLKNFMPATNVLPYEPASSLFADFAHKKRFLYMPQGTKATYNGDGNVLEYPVGAVLIKSFYYDNVMPNNVTQIIETRLLVRKADGWHAYDYIWNVAQTDAELDVLENGKIVPITWIQDGTQMSVNYKTPSQTQCVTCHKLNSSSIANGEKTIPIGPKPQNLNTTYNYATGAMNQLQKWKAMGFLGNDIPATINSTIDWRDVSQSLELRARSYIDINCAHCHRTGGHCDYAPQRFNFNNPNLRDFGVCLPATSASNGFIINGGSPSGSYLITKISSTEQAVMMPPIGRQVVDQEGLQLMTDWINSLPRCR